MAVPSRACWWSRLLWRSSVLWWPPAVQSSDLFAVETRRARSTVVPAALTGLCALAKSPLPGDVFLAETEPDGEQGVPAAHRGNRPLRRQRMAAFV